MVRDSSSCFNRIITGMDAVVGRRFRYNSSRLGTYPHNVRGKTSSKINHGFGKAVRKFIERGPGYTSAGFIPGRSSMIALAQLSDWTTVTPCGHSLLSPPWVIGKPDPILLTISTKSWRLDHYLLMTKRMRLEYWSRWWVTEKRMKKRRRWGRRKRY